MWFLESQCLDIEGHCDPVYRDELEMTGRIAALNYLKQCREGALAASLDNSCAFS